MDNNAIGYKKPPIDTRFKKGKSGNPKGRPRKQKMEETPWECLERHLNAMITVTEQGVKVKRSRFDIGMRQLANKFASGEPKALATVFKLRDKLASELATQKGRGDIMFEILPVKVYGAPPMLVRTSED